jgi:hypothetical protein
VKKCLEINKICKDGNDLGCIHNELDKILVIVMKSKVGKRFTNHFRFVNFCPICGFSYQPERLNPETPKGDAIV